MLLVTPMSKRAGPFATLFQILVTVPFAAAGIGSIAQAVRSGRLGGVIPGALFTAAAGWMFVRAIRARRSSESRSLGGVSATIADVVAPVVLDYRTAAAPSRTAAQIYAPLLLTAPLPRIRTKPGLVLARMLPPPSVANVFGLLFAAVFWNLVTLPFVVVAILERSFGLAAFVSIFVAVGIFLAVFAAKGILARAKLARVELSEEPVFVGDEVTIHVEQRGKAQVNRFEVDLVCRETVTFTVGTDTRSEDHDVFAQSLVDAGPVALARGERWPHQVTVRLPSNLPGTFRSARNAIRWLVRVRADIAGWPDYDELYELRVLPKVGS